MAETSAETLPETLPETCGASVAEPCRLGVVVKPLCVGLIACWSSCLVRERITRMVRFLKLAIAFSSTQLVEAELPNTKDPRSEPSILAAGLHRISPRSPGVSHLETRYHTITLISHACVGRVPPVAQLALRSTRVESPQKYNAPLSTWHLYLLGHSSSDALFSKKADKTHLAWPLFARRLKKDEITLKIECKSFQPALPDDGCRVRVSLHRARGAAIGFSIELNPQVGLTQTYRYSSRTPNGHSRVGNQALLPP